jgi:hypothetical protein
MGLRDGVGQDWSSFGVLDIEGDRLKHVGVDRATGLASGLELPLEHRGDGRRLELAVGRLDRARIDAVTVGGDDELESSPRRKCRRGSFQTDRQGAGW